MAAYYNEIDPQKAAWLRELIARNLIAPGDVDERSITDVRADELRGYRQCHFFAGIGIWSYALRLAGWPDDHPVWTGSCPCPSFSAAGKGQGFDDPRHLWPNWFGLIRECRPPVLFGEQVDDAIGHGWLDLVQTDLEGEAYAVGKAVLGACSVGAPHIRQRLYFCADHQRKGLERDARPDVQGRGVGPSRSGESFGGAHTANARCNDAREHRSRLPLLPARSEQRGETLCGPEPMRSERWPLLLDGSDGRDRQDGGRQEAHGEPGARGEVRAGDDSDSIGAGLAGWESQPEHDGQELPATERADCESGDLRDSPERGQSVCGCPPGISRYAALTGATRGFWANCDWWYGRDGKYRPIEPGLFPLAHGATARVGRLRGYGDGIVAQAAAAFVSAYLEADRTEQTA